jgi:hypothetical protein
MKNPFKSISKLFTKGGNAIGNTAKSMFSKSNMNTFRNTLQDTLNQQGDVLKKVGGITAGIAGNPLTLGATAILAPELLPFVAGVAGVGALTGGIGMVETSGAGLLSPKLYKGGALNSTGNVVNQIEKATKGGKQIAKFA